MKIGASYYPEIMAPADWERDLATGRELGLRVLRCGEFAWSNFEPTPGAWEPQWALDFLDVAQAHGYDVVWCTPSATPPPYLFDEGTGWPDLFAVSRKGQRLQVGNRRHYCPSHEGYRQRCAEVAGRIATLVGTHPAVVGWQVDNELAGDNLTCWCDGCRAAFQRWLRARYGTLDALNAAWQTGVWSQRYTAWEQFAIPVPRIVNHTPAHRLAYQRFRNATWLEFYSVQAGAVRRAYAAQNAPLKPITTNYYDHTGDIPFDWEEWRLQMEAVAIGMYREDHDGLRFQLAALNGSRPGERPLWVLEQKAGQQNAQNLFPEDLSRIGKHLRICRDAGAKYSVFWHLRQHSGGPENEHGAVLRHDGKPTRVAAAIKEAIVEINALEAQKAALADPAKPPGSEPLLAFSFDQAWAIAHHPQPGEPFDYTQWITAHWFGGLWDALHTERPVCNPNGFVVGSPADVTPAHRLVFAPYLANADEATTTRLRTCAEAGGTVVITADHGSRDTENNVHRAAPLAAIAALVPGFAVPEIEYLHLRPEAGLAGKLNGEPLQGHLFWAVSTAPLTPENGEPLGELALAEYTGPAALRLRVGTGQVIVLMTGLERTGVAALVRAV